MVELDSVFDELRAKLAKEGIEARLDELSDWPDVFLSLGGDGTLLGLSRKTLRYQKPILGMHYGRLGFLAQFETGDMDGVVKMLVKGDFEIKDRMVIEVKVGDVELFSINELVIRSRRTSGIVHLKLFSEGKYVNGYFGDGLIVATPTGSTGYNMSANGPIVYPYSNNFILTPICPHALTQRSLVLPGNSDKFEVRVEGGEAVVIVDGQEEIDIPKNGIIVFDKSELSLKMVCRNEGDFFAVIREKLNWGDHR